MTSDKRLLATRDYCVSVPLQNWFLKRPKYLIKYDLLNIVTSRKVTNIKILSYQEIELDEIFQMVWVDYYRSYNN